MFSFLFFFVVLCLFVRRQPKSLSRLVGKLDLDVLDITGAPFLPIYLGWGMGRGEGGVNGK